MKEIKAYACDYCNKFYKHKSSARMHEKRCFRNPNVRACLTCNKFDNHTMVNEYGEPYCHGYEKTMKRFDFKYGCVRWQLLEIEEEEITEDW